MCFKKGVKVKERESKISSKGELKEVDVIGGGRGGGGGGREEEEEKKKRRKSCM